MGMNEDLDKVIRYVYNEFGQEFGDIIVDLKQQLQSYKEKEDKLREYLKSNWVIDEPIKFKNDILDILNEGDK